MGSPALPAVERVQATTIVVATLALVTTLSSGPARPAETIHAQSSIKRMRPENPVKKYLALILSIAITSSCV